MVCVKTHSRPHVSDDNPYSEAHFKTLKYRPDFPDRFGSIEEARRFCREFFSWYNQEHHHAGLQLMTPATVHYGQAEKRIGARQSVLDAAYQAHPERFVQRLPQHPSLPEAVWINPPAAKQDNTPETSRPCVSWLLTCSARECQALDWESIVAVTDPLRTNSVRLPNDLATIVYTSGTPGSPKGVMHRFAAFPYFAKAVTQVTGRNRRHRVISYLPLAHIAERALTETSALYELKLKRPVLEAYYAPLIPEWIAANASLIWHGVGA